MPIFYLVQESTRGKVKFLQYNLQGNTIEKTWGLIGGKTQNAFSSYTGVNLGKANAKDPELVALEECRRVIETKVKEGYMRVNSLEGPFEFPDPFEAFNVNNIPTEFCCSKPTQTITPATINKLLKAGRARFFVKYNGGCHYILINKDREVTIYTRRWDDHTIKYPALVAEVAKNAEGFPAETLLVVELCVDPSFGMDHMMAFKKFAEISKTNTTKGVCKPDQSKALTIQEKYPVRAAVFGILYLDGGPAWHWVYEDMWPEIQKRVKPLSAGDILFQPQEAIFTSGDMAFEKAKAHKKLFEGFVMWDMKACMEVTFNGKPKRRASWKIKARGEMDVIAVGGEFGKVDGQYGSIRIARYNAKGDLVDMGAVSGLKPKEGETNPSYWTFPQVIEVTYDNIFPDTGLLQFGNFSKIHEDKKPEEVDLFSLVQ